MIFLSCTVVSRKYAPPFATLALVQNAGGAYTRDATIPLAITPSLSSLLGEGGGAYTRDKNTSAVLCAKNAGGAYARGGGRICGTLRYINIMQEYVSREIIFLKSP